MRDKLIEKARADSGDRGRQLLVLDQFIEIPMTFVAGTARPSVAYPYRTEEIVPTPEQ
jgi:hypothetical protein